MAQLHLIIGPVGAGKSTLALRLAEEHNAVRLILDEWMAVLFGADERPAEGRMAWYVARTERCLEQIWDLTRSLHRTGTDVVLEIGLIQRAARQAFYNRVDEEAYDLNVYLVETDRATRRSRVLQRNRQKGRTYSMEVPEEIFELASDLWEAPEDDERAERKIRVVSGQSTTSQGTLTPFHRDTRTDD